MVTLLAVTPLEQFVILPTPEAQDELLAPELLRLYPVAHLTQVQYLLEEVNMEVIPSQLVKLAAVLAVIPLNGAADTVDVA